MGQQQRQKEGHHTERHAVLTGLDAKIDDLDVAIASLIAEQHTLKRARQYVLSTHAKASRSSNDNTTPANTFPKLPMRPTYPSPSFTAKKAPSRLHQEVLIRNAMERDKSSSPPGSVGLLSSDEFEVSFPNHNVLRGNNDGNVNGCCGDIDGKGDVRMSIEGMSSSAAEKHSALSPTTTADPASRSNTPSPASDTNALRPSSRNGQGAHWQAKRINKRKLQENPAKAREVRMRKLQAANSAAA